MAARAADGGHGAMRTVSWLVMGVAAAAAIGVGAALVTSAPEPVALRSGTALAEPRPLPEFSLVDAHGRPFGRAALERRWSILFSGFTHCPDVCPTTLALLANLRSRMPADDLQFVFLSVDPDRDTPDVVARYLAHFGDGLVGVTGPPMEVDRLAGALGLAHVRNPGADGGYTVDHSTALVLIDPEARIAGYFTAPHDPDALAADLAPLAR
jgi:protein SCO1